MADEPDHDHDDEIPADLLALSVALDTGDAATTAEAARALREWAEAVEQAE
jgi:hypothetical protein